MTSNELYCKNLSEFIGYINGIYKTSLICGAAARPIILKLSNRI